MDKVQTDSSSTPVKVVRKYFYHKTAQLMRKLREELEKEWRETDENSQRAAEQSNIVLFNGIVSYRA